MLDNQSIKSLAHSNATASTIFLIMSQRERARHVLNLDLLLSNAIAQSKDVSKEVFYETFKQLHNLKVGYIIYGRKGNNHKFVWTYDMKDVAKIGLGILDIVPRKSMPKKKVGQRVLKVSPTRNVTLKTPTIQGKIDRNGFINISIPLNLLEIFKHVKHH